MSNIIPMPQPHDDYDDISSLEKLAYHFKNSGFFKDLRSESQAIVKILKGRELGIGPFTACDQINFINGKPSPNANLIAALIKKSGKYDYEILELSNTICSIQMYQNGQPKGKPIEFTLEDAKKAGLTRNSTYAAYPKNMLFARCISNASRFVCPEVTTGLYVPEDWEDLGVGMPSLPESSKPSSATSDLIQLSMETSTSLGDINDHLQSEFRTWEEISKDAALLTQVLKFLQAKKEVQ